MASRRSTSTCSATPSRAGRRRACRITTVRWHREASRRWRGSALRRWPRLSPALVLCSSARRGAACNGVLPALPADTTVEIEHDLYAASGGRLLARLRRLDDDVPGVLVIGHNPGIHSLASMLSRRWRPRAAGTAGDRLPDRCARHARPQRLLGRPRAWLGDAAGLRGPTRPALIPVTPAELRGPRDRLSVGAAPSASGWSSRPADPPRRAARSRRRWWRIRCGGVC